MHRKKSSRLPSAAHDGVAVAQPKNETTKLASRVRLSKTDFTFEDWRRIEFGERSSLCPYRDVMNHYQWRI